jgi:group I intron endonuclease
MRVYIYALICPLTNDIKYIGKTVQKLRARLKSHLSIRPNDNTYRANWIKQLKTNNLKPSIILIEECTDIDWEDREKYWISFYSKTHDLVNYSKGGQGRCENKLSTKEKMSEITKERWKNEEYRIKMCNMSKKMWENEEYRKNRLTDESKEKIRQSRLGKKTNEKTKKKQSEKSKEMWVKNKKKLNKTRFKKPIIVDNNIFESIEEASKFLGLDASTVCRRVKSDKYPNYQLHIYQT